MNSSYQLKLQRANHLPFNKEQKHYSYNLSIIRMYYIRPVQITDIWKNKGYAYLLIKQTILV